LSTASNTAIAYDTSLDPQGLRLINCLPEGLLIKDAAGRFILANPAAAGLLGVEAPQMLLGKTDFSFYTFAQVARLRAQEAAVWSGRTVSADAEPLTDRVTGTVRWIQTTKSPWIDDTGKVMGIIVVMREAPPPGSPGPRDRPPTSDPSGTQPSPQQEELQNALEHALAHEGGLLRTIIDSIPAKIYAKDLQSRFVACNVSIAQAMGTTPEGLLGKTDFDFFPPAMAEGFFADEQAVIRSGQALIDREESVLDHITGIEHEISTTKVPFHDRAGNVIGVVGIGLDITERKRADAELVAAYKQLLDISRQAGMAEVATGVLHNVGNVLNSVNVSANVLVEYVGKSRASDLARVTAALREHEGDLGNFVTLHPQGKHLISFLDSLDQQLTAERQAMTQEIEILLERVGHIKEIVMMQQSYAVVAGVQEQLKATDLAEDSLRLIAAAFTRHGIEIVRDYEHAPLINVDKHKALQILVNLATNAKHACAESGRSDKRITIRVVSAGPCVKISVTDNGVGIPQENLTRIFNHGFTTRKTGHGFGLHSGALAARELGGSLTVRSEGPGHGATFTLELPLPASQPTSEQEVRHAVRAFT
jgi:PAS domain S-box-containing protein